MLWLSWKFKLADKFVLFLVWSIVDFIWGLSFVFCFGIFYSLWYCVGNLCVVEPNEYYKFFDYIMVLWFSTCVQLHVIVVPVLSELDSFPKSNLSIEDGYAVFVPLDNYGFWQRKWWWHFSWWWKHALTRSWTHACISQLESGKCFACPTKVAGYLNLSLNVNAWFESWGPIVLCIINSMII